MSERTNRFGQPVGPPVEGWTPPPPPPREPLEGRWCRLEPLAAARHAVALHEAFRDDDRLWTYLGYGPFPDAEAFRRWVVEASRGDDPLFLAVVVDGRPAGQASWCRIDPPVGSIEVGHLAYSGRLRRSTAATEAMYLMMKRAFELGYRRYEWKCDALNAPSVRAAERLGFRYEGTFRQDRIYKGRSRDTAWFSVVDREWPAVRDELERWLAEENFDAGGVQRTPLTMPGRSDGAGHRRR